MLAENEMGVMCLFDAGRAQTQRSEHVPNAYHSEGTDEINGSSLPRRQSSNAHKSIVMPSAGYAAQFNNSRVPLQSTFSRMGPIRLAPNKLSVFVE